MFNKVRVNDAILRFYQRVQPVAFSNAETLYDDLILLRDQLVEYGNLNNEMVVYLNSFIESFDENLLNVSREVLEKWFTDGDLESFIRGLINEEVYASRGGYTYLPNRLNALDTTIENVDHKAIENTTNINYLTEKFSGLSSSSTFKGSASNADIIAIQNPNNGDEWYDTTNQNFVRWNGESWVVVGSESLIGDRVISNNNIKVGEIKPSVLNTNVESGYNFYNSEYQVEMGKLANSNGSVSNATGWAVAVIPIQDATKLAIYNPNGDYTGNVGAIIFRHNDELVSFTYGPENTSKVAGSYHSTNYIILDVPEGANNVVLNVLRPSTGAFDFRSSLIVAKDDIPIMLNSREKGIKDLAGKNMNDTNLRTDFKKFKDSIKVTGNNLYDKEKVFGDYLVASGGYLEKASGWAYARVSLENKSTNNKVSIYNPQGKYYGDIGSVVFNKGNKIVSHVYPVSEHISGSVNGVNYVTLDIPPSADNIMLTVIRPSASAFNYVDSLVVVYGDTITSSDINPKITSIGGYSLDGAGTPSYDDKLWVVGLDSLTEVNSRSSKFYHQFIAERLGIQVHNIGLSGSGYKRLEDTNNALYQRILNIPTETDVVTLFGGGNDLTLIQTGTPLGTVNDSTTDTLAGCINKTIDNLFSVVPLVSLGLITPTPWNDLKPSTDNNMRKLSDLIIEIGKSRGIPVLDLYRLSQLRPWETSYKQIVYSNDGGNGVHFNEIGHEKISYMIESFLKSII